MIIKVNERGYEYDARRNVLDRAIGCTDSSFFKEKRSTS